jgi:hypothetical protein
MNLLTINKMIIPGYISSLLYKRIVKSYLSTFGKPSPSTGKKTGLMIEAGVWTFHHTEAAHWHRQFVKLVGLDYTASADVRVKKYAQRCHTKSNKISCLWCRWMTSLDKTPIWEGGIHFSWYQCQGEVCWDVDATINSHDRAHAPSLNKRC